MNYRKRYNEILFMHRYTSVRAFAEGSIKKPYNDNQVNKQYDLACKALLSCACHNKMESFRMILVTLDKNGFDKETLDYMAIDAKATANTIRI